MRRRSLLSASCLVATLLAGRPHPAWAEQNVLRIARTATMGHLPIIVLERERLVEKHAAQQDMPDLKVSFATFGGPSPQIDALLSGNIDIASVGSSGLLTLWAKTKGTPSEVKGIAALGSMPMALNTRDPKVRSITDLSEADRIAVPSIKISFNAMLLQMAAAKQWGMASYAKLDPLTVSLGQMDAVAAVMSGRSEINSDFTTPPFLQIELGDPAVHSVVTLREILGERGTIATSAATTRFHDANPKLVRVYLAALQEAMALIAADKERAVDSYIAITGDRTTPREILVRSVSDPDVEFTTTPRSMMVYARFMKDTGIIKRVPEAVGDLFFDLPRGGS